MNVFTLSFVLLLVLKVTELAAISWWVVFSPIIIGLVLALAFVLLVAK